jgi:superfamily II DNA or RNA helicase
MGEILRKCIEKKINYIVILHEEIIDEDKCYMQVEMAQESVGASDELIKTLENSTTRFNKKYFDKIKASLLRCADENYTHQQIYDKYTNIPKCFLDFLLYDQNDLSQNPEEENKEYEENIEDKYDEIDDDLEKNINNFNWRFNQIKAIENTTQQGYCSGIHNQIMGSGKTYIMLNLISKHYSEYNKNNIYIICCDRQEVLKKIFFDGTMLDGQKIKFWKSNNIIDFKKYNLIDCVNNKPTRLNVQRDKPNILLINNDYLMALNKKNKIDWIDVSLMILDECHCVSGNKFHKLLHKIKYEKKISIIGFSATPLRDKADDKVIDIFSKDNKKINIISHYDLMMAISDEIVLPFTCEYVEIKKNRGEKIGVQNKQIAQKMFGNIVPILPYKKIIMWCRKIVHMVDYYNYFKELYGKRYDIYCTSSKDDKLSRLGYNINIDEFYKKKNYAILFCVNRCREGSDIMNVDCGIFLDGVMKRSTLVSMQTGGRIMRPDNDGLKKRAYLIDTFVCQNNQQVELFTIGKVIGYYQKLLNLSDNCDDEKYDEYYENMILIASRTIIDEKKETIIIKVDDNVKHDIRLKIQMTTKKIDWNILKTLIKNEIDRKFKIDRDTQFNQIINNLKKLNIFDIMCTDFWKVYRDIPQETKDKYFLPINLYKEYQDKFEKTSWYTLLDLDTSCWYQTIKECHDAISKNKKIDVNKMSKTYYHDVCIKYDKKLPIFPEEHLKFYGFKYYEDFE